MYDVYISCMYMIHLGEYTMCIEKIYIEFSEV